MDLSRGARLGRLPTHMQRLRRAPVLKPRCPWPAGMMTLACDLTRVPTQGVARQNAPCFIMNAADGRCSCCCRSSRSSRSSTHTSTHTRTRTHTHTCWSTTARTLSFMLLSIAVLQERLGAIAAMEQALADRLHISRGLAGALLSKTAFDVAKVACAALSHPRRWSSCTRLPACV